MSDCSTEAMKPKAFDLHECVDCEHYCAECYDCCKGVPDHQDCMFRCWTPSRAYKLEQRYQQLEQMVRRMYQYIKNDADESWSPVKEKVAKHYREEIEALGVSLDDAAVDSLHGDWGDRDD